MITGQERQELVSFLYNTRRVKVVYFFQKSRGPHTCTNSVKQTLFSPPTNLGTRLACSMVYSLLKSRSAMLSLPYKYVVCYKSHTKVLYPFHNVRKRASAVWHCPVLVTTSQESFQDNHIHSLALK